MVLFVNKNLRSITKWDILEDSEKRKAKRTSENKMKLQISVTIAEPFVFDQ